MLRVDYRQRTKYGQIIAAFGGNSFLAISQRDTRFGELAGTSVRGSGYTRFYHGKHLSNFTDATCTIRLSSSNTGSFPLVVGRHPGLTKDSSNYDLAIKLCLQYKMPRP
jgi:hypothetical protein